MADRIHLIDGCWLSGEGPQFTATDPGLGEVVWRGRSATAREVGLSVGAADRASEAWADRPLSERIGILEAFQQLVTARRWELAECISLDTGKPRWEALTEVDSMAAKVPVSIEAYNDRCRVVQGRMGAIRTVVRFKPHGVVVVIGPFNLPGHLPNGHIVAALLAGNTVVFKPSRQAPLIAVKMMETWQEAGLPPGVLNMVQGGRETATALVGDPRIDGLLFTGSVKTGKALHRAFAGFPEKILALEMGGNGPLVVHEVSDLEAAAYLTVQSAFITAGQRCTCARRLIVPAGDAGDRFMERLASLVREIRVGRYTDLPERFMGPVISEQVLKDLLRAQEDLCSAGARSLVPMKRLERPGYFLSPGILDVTAVKDRPDVELFGPILQMVRVPDFQAAVREAGNTSFGLAAGLLSDNEELYDLFFRKVRAGVVNWNRQTTGASGRLPFGGVGASGNHRPSGYYAADYCSFPVASMESDVGAIPESRTPGIGEVPGDTVP